MDETGARQLDEAGEAGGRQIDEAGARQLDETAGRQLDPHSARRVEETAARQLDEAGETGARQLDEAGEVTARELDEGADAARQFDETGEGAARQLDETGARRVTEDLTDIPPKGNEAIRELDTGARITDDLVPETGLTRGHIDELETYARNNDLNVTGRSTNPHSAQHLADGTAVRKPLDIKIKTGNDIDVLLGADARNRGVVTLFEPKMPNTTGMSDDLVEALHRRHTSRLKEWNKYKDSWVARGERTMSFGGTARPQRYMNGRIEVMVDGQWKSVAGDFDLVNLTRADGTRLSAAEFNMHVKEMVQEGLVEHGGELRVMTDMMRNSPHVPGSDAWMKQAAEVWELRNSLENAYGEAGEIVIGINGREGLHRAADPDLLRWAGGFEGADGRMIDFGSSPGLGGALPDLSGAAPAAPGILRGVGDGLDDPETP